MNCSIYPIFSPFFPNDVKYFTILIGNSYSFLISLHVKTKILF